MNPDRTRVVNATKLASACAHLAYQLRGEADRWSGDRRLILIQDSSQLTRATGMTLRDPEAVIAVYKAAVTILAATMAERARRDEAAFLANPKGFAHE